MACCAFGLFLLSQILLPFRRVRTFLFGPETERVGNASVAWSLRGDGTAAAAAGPRVRLSRRMLAGLVTAELVLFALGGWAVVSHGRHWVAEAHAAAFGPTLPDELCLTDDQDPANTETAQPD